MPRPQNPMQFPQRVLYAQPRRRRRRRFRREWFTVPLAILVAFWFLHHIQIHQSLSLEAWMDFMQVHDRERYRQLFMLCVLGTGICILFRVWRKPPEKI